MELDGLPSTFMPPSAVTFDLWPFDPESQSAYLWTRIQLWPKFADIPPICF